MSVVCRNVTVKLSAKDLRKCLSDYSCVKIVLRIKKKGIFYFLLQELSENETDFLPHVEFHVISTAFF